MNQENEVAKLIFELMKLHTVAQKTVPMFGHFSKIDSYHNIHLELYFENFILIA